jgi:hypothetical protein
MLRYTRIAYLVYRKNTTYIHSAEGFIYMVLLILLSGRRQGRHVLSAFQYGRFELLFNIENT